MTPVEITRGSSPVILGLPHTGTHVPAGIREQLNDEGRKLRDTDWHVDRLYGGLLPGATTVRATFHRYVIDANRDPSGVSLYPGQNTTGLVPLTDFDNQPIWRQGAEPTARDVDERLQTFHTPYHAALRAEVDRVLAEHEIAIIYDCHSIRSRCPFLFDGRLPDFNIGTNNGASCAPALELAVIDICSVAEGYSHVVNGRFRGGWTTRHYGQPHRAVHAIQMELAQAAYLKSGEPPFAYDELRAGKLRDHLGAILTRLNDIALTITPGAKP
ncbi:MAG: N-formylglutamate deformylase [Rhizobiaceae bacterium]